MAIPLIKIIKKNFVWAITVIPGVAIVFCFALFSTAMAADIGATLIFSSLPSGADVVCNDKRVGKTRFKLSGIKAHKSIEIQFVLDNNVLQTTIQYLQASEIFRIRANFNKNTIRVGRDLADHLIFLRARVKGGRQKAHQIIAGLSRSRKAEIAEALAHSRLAEHIRKGAAYSEKRNITRVIMELKNSLGQLRWNYAYTAKALEYIYGNNTAVCWLARLPNGTYIEFENSYKTLSPHFNKGDWITLYIKASNPSGTKCVFDLSVPQKCLEEKYQISKCRHFSNVVKIEKKIYPEYPQKKK